jgi:hypothetical protein
MSTPLIWPKTTTAVNHGQYWRAEARIYNDLALEIGMHSVWQSRSKWYTKAAQEEI